MWGPLRGLICVLAVGLCAGVLAQPGAVPAASSASGSQASAPASTPAGTVALVGGDVRILRAGSAPRRAAVGDLVNEGDSLVTGKDSEVHLAMQDAGFIALRPNTRFKILSYRAEGGDDDKGVFSLLVGGMRSVTGWIGRFNQAAYQVRTPSATIGIRGTDHETRYLPAGSTEGEPGTYDKVFAGGTTIRTEGGQTEVAADQAGFVAPNVRERPRVLDRVPAFFRPGPHEAEIEMKHAQIQQVIAQRRDERRKVLAEKRAALGAAQAGFKAQQETNKAAAEQRRATAQEQLDSIRQRREALRGQFQALEETQKSLDQRRRALKQSGVGEQNVTSEQRAQLKTLLADEKTAREQRQALQAQRKALTEENETATENRRKAMADQLKASLDKLSDVQQKATDLKQERQATEQELKTLREQEQKRYRDERKADRQRRPASGARVDDKQTP